MKHIFSKFPRFRFSFQMRLLVLITSLGLILIGSPLLPTKQAQATSTGNLYVITSTLTNPTTTTLNKIDQTTGALTPIGNPLENSLPGLNAVLDSAYDSVGHRIFYSVQTSNCGIANSNCVSIVIQDTQTGALTVLPPAGILPGMLEYDSSSGNLYVITSTLTNPTTTTLNKIDQTTGALTPIGNPLENSLPGLNAVLDSAYDSVGHRIFYTVQTSNAGGPNSNGVSLVIQNTQTGTLTVLSLAGILPGMLEYDSSSGNLYVITSTLTNPTTTTLNKIDQTTGALTPIGNPLENSLPGLNAVLDSAYDSVGHRIFYSVQTSNCGIANSNCVSIVIQDTQTGALAVLPPAGILPGMLEYEPPTPPVISSLSNKTINKGTTYTTSGSFVDSNSTSWTATVNYGDNTGTKALTLSGMNFSLNHAYNNLGAFTLSVNISGNDGLTGTGSALITVIPLNGLAGANLSHTNYTGAVFDGQDLSKADLSVAIFNNTSFQNANLSQVTGSNSSFTQANFTGANLNKINFSNSNLAGSNFTNAIVTQGNLSNTNLTNANFTGTNLTGANLSGTTLTGVTWSNTICPNGTSSNNDGNTCVGQGGGL